MSPAPKMNMLCGKKWLPASKSSDWLNSAVLHSDGSFPAYGYCRHECTLKTPVSVISVRSEATFFCMPFHKKLLTASLMRSLLQRARQNSSDQLQQHNCDRVDFTSCSSSVQAETYLKLDSMALMKKLAKIMTYFACPRFAEALSLYCASVMQVMVIYEQQWRICLRFDNFPNPSASRSHGEIRD